MPVSSAKTLKTSPKQDDNLYSVCFSLASDYKLGWCGEPSDFLSGFRAEINYYDDSTDDREYDEPDPPNPSGVVTDPHNRALKIIGTLDGFLIPFAKYYNADDAPSLFDILDSESGETHEFYHAFFEDDELRPQFFDAAEMFPESILLLTLMEIAPSFRGRGLGLLLLKALREAPFLPSSTIVGLKPWATGHEKGSKAEKSGTKKLFAYWKKAGYERIEQTEYVWTYLP